MIQVEFSTSVDTDATRVVALPARNGVLELGDSRMYTNADTAVAVRSIDLARGDRSDETCPAKIARTDRTPVDTDASACPSDLPLADRQVSRTEMQVGTPAGDGDLLPGEFDGAEGVAETSGLCATVLARTVHVSARAAVVTDAALFDSPRRRFIGTTIVGQALALGVEMEWSERTASARISDFDPLAHSRESRGGMNFKTAPRVAPPGKCGLDRVLLLGPMGNCPAFPCVEMVHQWARVGFHDVDLQGVADQPGQGTKVAFDCIAEGEYRWRQSFFFDAIPVAPDSSQADEGSDPQDCLVRRVGPLRVSETVKSPRTFWDTALLISGDSEPAPADPWSVRTTFGEPAAEGNDVLQGFDPDSSSTAIEGTMDLQLGAEMVSEAREPDIGSLDREADLAAESVFLNGKISVFPIAGFRASAYKEAVLLMHCVISGVALVR